MGIGRKPEDAAKNVKFVWDWVDILSVFRYNTNETTTNQQKTKNVDKPASDLTAG